MIIAFWKTFRLVFVIFSLYLLGDAFYRWDGFRYYASFSDFLPSVGLVSILWSIVAVFTSIVIWLPLKGLQWLFKRMGRHIDFEDLLIFMCCFIFIGTAAWVTKRSFFGGGSGILQKIAVLLCVIFATFLVTRILRGRLNIILERITPLVWLFGIMVLFSMPLVAYHTWLKDTDSPAPQKVTKPSVADRTWPNIILVTFDALSAKDMSVYGYEVPTTPFIEKWATTASLFTRASSADNWTTPATASLMSGKRPWSHQLYSIGSSQFLNSDTESLPLLLRNNGYKTIALVANASASPDVLGISNGFVIAPSTVSFAKPSTLFGMGMIVGHIDKFIYEIFCGKIKLCDWILTEDFLFAKMLYFNYKYLNISETTVPPDLAFTMYFEIARGNPGQPVFAWIHLLPPHAPYLPEEPYMGMFDPSSELRSFRDQVKVPLNAEFSREQKFIVDNHRARYDEFIRYSDAQFEEFITQLTSRDEFQNTVVILSSDHGEGFEHNYAGHAGPHLYEELIHIPLVIKSPGQGKGKVINDLVEQIDIPATILDFAGIPVPSWMEGRSLVPLIRGEGLPSKPSFSTTFRMNPSRGHKIEKGAIAVSEGNHKLVHYLDRNESLLFNLRDDPDELHNLFEKDYETGKHLLSLIQDNLNRANQRILRK